MSLENFFPYNEMTIESDTTIGACVRIPKIYIKGSENSEGLITREISKTEKPGFHCHPAFMQNGLERDAILIASNPSATNMSFADAQNEVENLPVDGIKQLTKGTTFGTWQKMKDVHMYNIYEHHLMALLMLIEYGTTNITTTIYHGINYNWSNEFEWIDGIKTNETNVLIYDNKGNFEYKTLTAKTGKSGYIKDLLNIKNNDIDTNDIFIMEIGTENEIEGSYGVRQDLNFNNSPIMINTNYPEILVNPFTLATDEYSGKYRLAKFADNPEE